LIFTAEMFEGSSIFKTISSAPVPPSTVSEFVVSSTVRVIVSSPGPAATVPSDALRLSSPVVPHWFCVVGSHPGIGLPPFPPTPSP
jgi:hypothetical protein